ncbi:Protein misato 1 [Geranomyces variabilis]|uniref:Protein misato 1 n=1 Tax=Geranomyces variabilis TaxID=109894 RepID=A0AAD5TJM9_9FUNG|nr:Protein misato 1 [Geranomyces variabilis]
MPREILTLQLGHTANFVGTHFWNTQDAYFALSETAAAPAAPELDHDVLYRAGRNVYGEETYTPRLVILDLKGSLKTLKKVSPLYEAADDDGSSAAATWGGKVERHAQEPYAKNDFLTHLDENASHSSSTEPAQSFSTHLESSVTVWSDFNKLYYHPKTVVEVPHFLHDDDLKPFSAFTQGLDVMADHDFRDEFLEERMRFFVEESDSLQGFNLIADATDGFAGITANLLEYISDEFSKKSAMTFGVHPPFDRFDTDKGRKVATLNSSLLIEAAARSSSLYVPLYAPYAAGGGDNAWRYLKNDLSSTYKWSACLAAGIETALLPVRLKMHALQLGTLAELVSGGSARTVAGLSLGLPFPLHSGGSYADAFAGAGKEQRADWMADLTLQRGYDQLGDEFGQCFVVRGIPELARVSQARTRPPINSEIVATVDGFLRAASSTRGESYSVDAAFPICESFPQLFDSRITPDGLIDDSQAKTQSNPTTRIAAATRLSMAPAHGGLLRTAGEAFTRGAFAKLVAMYEKGDRGLDDEDRRALKESLEEAASRYGEPDYE